MATWRTANGKLLRARARALVRVRARSCAFVRVRARSYRCLSIVLFCVLRVAAAAAAAAAAAIIAAATAAFADIEPRGLDERVGADARRFSNVTRYETRSRSWRRRAGGRSGCSGCSIGGDGGRRRRAGGRAGLMANRLRMHDV